MAWELPTGADASDDGSSSGEPFDPSFEKPDVGGGHGSGSTGDDGASETAGALDADFMGVHDGVYAGTVTIAFTPGGQCSGEVTITVDSTADPQIVGEGECIGVIIAGVEGGSTEIDGILELDAPSGQARQDIDGTIVEVVWDGSFTDADFDGAFDGTLDLDGAPLDFIGSWTVVRQ